MSDGVFVTVDGIVQPAPAPRFSVTAAHTPAPPAVPGSETDDALLEAGRCAEEIARLKRDGVVA